MLPSNNQVCPLDGSELVFLGGWAACPGKPDMAYFYCPCCDAGFIYWDDPGRQEPVVFTWRRRGKKLLLSEGEVTRAAEYRQHGWKEAESSLLRGVNWFLKARFSKEHSCPNDATNIPLVAVFPYQAGGSALFYWCIHCQELFLYLMDRDYGWQLIASFCYDQAKESYGLCRVFRDKVGVDRLREYVSKVPPPSQFTC
jgi:hypothetical protein